MHSINSAFFVLALLLGAASAASGPVQAPPLPPAPDWTAEGQQDWAHFGLAAGRAGDVNADGYGDLIAGAHLYDGGQTDEGAAFLYLGSPAGLGAQPAWSAEGDQAYAYFGRAVSDAGDVDGDGYDDVLVGAYGYERAASEEGRIYLYRGTDGGLTPQPTWSADGGQAYANLGWSVSGAGDLNGDGYDDLAAGAPFYDNGQADEGIAWVFYGSPSGPSPAHGWQGESDQEGAFFGFSLAGAGDVNGDGYDDLLVGAYGYDNPLEREGRVYLFYGSAGGLSPAAGWTAESGQAGSCYGLAVAAAGDLNADGYDDLAVGAYLYDGTLQDEGAVLVYLGSASGPSAEPDWIAYGGQASAFLGFALGAAGDLDGDGFGDLAAGAHAYDDGQMDEGRALVWLGSAAGLRSEPDWAAASDQEGAHFGRPVRSAGDVNGDGRADLVAGASSWDGGQVDEGAVFVYYGVPGETLHLSLLKLGWKPGPKPGTYVLSAAAAVHDGDHAPAPGVRVAGTWTAPDGAITAQTALTDARGQVRFLLKARLAGAYQFCVTGMAKEGYADNPANDHSPRCRTVQVGE